MASVVARRVTDTERLSVASSPFEAGLALWPDDIAAFLDGDIDDALLVDLIFGFLWVDWRRSGSRDALAELRSRWSVALSDRPASRSWALLKLLFTSSALRSPAGESLKVRPESSIVPLLCAGRVGEACQIAQRRLLVSGLNPLRVHFSDSSDGTRIAAALLFPVRIAPLMRWSSAQKGEEDVRSA
jgi:CRISPR-associated protein Csx17